MVGATAAHSIAIREIVSDVVLIDVAEDLVRGQAMDINHATGYTNGVHVRVGSYDDIKENDIIVITCGLHQKPGQTRMDLLEANVKIIRDVTHKVMQGSKDKPVYIVMVSNPVDVLTYIALKESGLPKERVLGTGTTLDTARLRVTLAHELHVSQQQIETYILGEHGDSSFATLSSASIGGIPLVKFPGFQQSTVETIEQDIRNAAYNIIAAKKSTYYGIGNIVAKIVEALVKDTRDILPVCSIAEGEYGLENVAISLPSLVGIHGVKILDGHPLDKAETESLHASAHIIQDAISSVR
jgi:L-lactate dehydrogenase